MTKTLALALACALALAACSPSGTTTVIEYDQVETVDSVVAAADGDAVAAAAGVLVALDRGYSFESIVAAIDAGLFEPHYGFVRDAADGNPVPPEGVDSGIIVDKPSIGLDAQALPSAIDLAGSHGYARQSTNFASGDVMLATLLDSIGSTFGGLNFGAKSVEELLAQPADELPNQWSGLSETETRNRLAVTAIMGLASSGYSLEQIVFTIVTGVRVTCLPFGNVDGSPCLIPDVKPELVAPGIFGGTGEPAAADADEDSSDSGVFLGTADVSLHDFGGVTTLSEAVFYVGEDGLSGTVEYGLETEIYRDGTRNIGCQYLLIEFIEVPLTDASSGTYAGMMSIYRPDTEYNTECGVAFAGAGGFTYERDVTFTLDGDTLTGTADALGWTFTATRESANA